MGATGFGDAILLYVLLALFGSSAPEGSSDLREALLLITLGGLGSMGVQACILWNKVNWKLTFWLSVPVVIFTMVGMSSLQYLSAFVLILKRCLGLLFLTVAFYKTRLEINAKIGKESVGPRIVRDPLGSGEDQLATLLAGSASGFLAGLYGTGGPPLMVWVATYKVPKDEWRASNAVVWLICNVFRLFHLIFFQDLHETDAFGLLVVILAISGVLGAYAGAKISESMGDYLFRVSIIVLLIFGANIMIFAKRPYLEPLIGILVTFSTVFVYYSYRLADSGQFSDTSSVHALFDYVIQLYDSLTGADSSMRDSSGLELYKYKPVSMDEEDQGEDDDDCDGVNNGDDQLLIHSDSNNSFAIARV
jgi:uncharacterized membrane protein YfcA